MAASREPHSLRSHSMMDFILDERKPPASGDDGEAEPAIAGDSPFELGNDDDDVIDARQYGASSLASRCARLGMGAHPEGTGILPMVSTR